MMNAQKLYLLAQLERFRTLRAYQVKDWRSIVIKENGEPLQSVPTECAHPFYVHDLKIAHNPVIYLRESVLAQFMHARSILTRIGYDLFVYDGWRSVELQSHLFWHYMKEFTIKKFSLENEFISCNSPGEIEKKFLDLPHSMRETLKSANRSYVSWPSTDPKCPSPHATGGSVDVWLYRDGIPLNMGVPFDWMHEEAGAFYHLKYKRRKFIPNDKKVVYYRNIMMYAMTKSGFTCYGPEFWHFNLGNQMDAMVKNVNAIYSYIEPK